MSNFTGNKWIDPRGYLEVISPGKFISRKSNSGAFKKKTFYSQFISIQIRWHMTHIFVMLPEGDFPMLS